MGKLEGKVAVVTGAARGLGHVWGAAATPSWARRHIVIRGHKTRIRRRLRSGDAELIDLQRAF